MRKLFILLAVGALVVAFTTPSFAAMKGAAVNIYGNVRFDTFSTKVSATAAAPNFDDRDTWWAGDFLNSRLGINFKAGDVTGHWEWRPVAGTTIRHFYGTWNFGQGQLVVGQTWDPIFLSAACATAARASGTYVGTYGDLAGCLRVQQIAIWMKGFKVAFSTPTTANISNAAAAAWNQDATFPKVHVTYAFKFQPFWVNLFGGYNQYKLGNITTDQEIDIKSWLYGIQAGIATGPFMVRALIWKCENPWEFGLFGYTGVAMAPSGIVSTYQAVYNAANNQVIDSQVVGGGISGTYKINDMFSVAGGYLMVEGSRPAAIAGQFEVENDAAAYYVNVPITLAKNVRVVPEIGKADEKDQRTALGAVGEDGDVEWWGAWWYIGW
jgi:hypothetical protein